VLGAAPEQVQHISVGQEFFIPPVVTEGDILCSQLILEYAKS